MPPPPVPPGMSPMPPYQPPAPPRTNGFAIGSLVCGLLGCFPIVLTALAAVVLGILGIKKANQPNTGGKGLAIAGLVLGVLGLLWSAGFIGGGYFTYRFAQKNVIQPTQQIGGSFVNSLSSGDIATAQSFVGSGMSQDELTQLSNKLKSYGTFKDFSISNIQADAGSKSIVISGSANFQDTSKAFSARFSGEVTNPSSYKIEDFDID